MRVVVLLLVAVMLVAGCSGPKESSTQIVGPTTQPPSGIDFQDEDDVVVEDTGCGGPVTGLVLTVKEPGGFPLNGYPVSLIGTEHSGTTDQEGRVRFVNLTAGPLVVRVTPQDHWYKVTQANVTVREGCLIQATLTVPLKDGYLTPPHVHDDWKGRTTFELFSMEIDVDCVYGPFQVRCAGPDGESPGRMQFPVPVPVGTGWLNITADFESTALAPYIVLQINRPQWTGATFRLAAGEPYTFVDDPYALGDVPHATRSRWNFAFSNGAPTDVPQLVEGPITIRVDVTKSPHPLKIDPPHPDFWGNRTDVRLVDTTTSWQAATTYTNQNPPPTSQTMAFEEGMLVFPGTREVVFTAWINRTAPSQQPVELWYWMQPGAGTPPNDITRLVGDTTDGVRYEWRIEVAPDEYDNLYLANASYFDRDTGYFETGGGDSQWRFHLRTSSVSQDVYFSYPGQADIHLIATAYKM